MSKIAIVGCQQSGKTVFMASLSDYFRAGQREGQTCWLIPENSAAHKFTEMRNYEMRVQGIWPEATLTDPTSLTWSLRQKDGTKTDIEMLEFSGEVFRAAFREEGASPQHKEAAEHLVSYLFDADFVVVLVGLNELFRVEEDQSLLEDDIESTWVTRGLIDFVKKNLPPRVGLVVALTQADLYKSEIERFGGAAGVLKARWPMIYALYPDVPVVAVASVSKTTADGRPAEGYTTEGVLPVMKAYSDFLYGDPRDLIAELDEISGFLENVSQGCEVGTVEQKLERQRQILEELNKRTAIVNALYDDIVQQHRLLNNEGVSMVASLRAILSRPIEERLDSSTWDVLRTQAPHLTKTVDAFEAATLERNKVLQAEKVRKEEAERKAREIEARRLEESARRDEARRRQLELDEKEQRAAAEKLRIQKEQSRVALRAFMIRAVSVFLIILAIGVGVKKWRESAVRQHLAQIEKTRQMERERKARIESENAVALAEVRKAEAARHALEEKNRAEELAQKRLENEKIRRELELKKQMEDRIAAEEERRRVVAENERQRLLLEREKAEEERRLEEARHKRLAEENRRRQIEIEREVALRKVEEAKQRKLEEEKERERLECARKEQERLVEEAKARKLAEDKANAANLLSRLVATVGEGVVVRSKELIDELKPNTNLLSTEEKKLFDEACVGYDLISKADSGDESAIVRLAQSYSRGTAVFKVDYGMAYKWYLKTADGGDPLSQYKVGEMLVRGDGVAENASLAHSYFLRSAEMNYPKAQFAVAELYRMGKGVGKNERKANYWYQKGAESGNPDCQFAWARRLQNGEGMIFSDKKAAFEWLFKAARSGHGEACYLIGCQYYSGSENLKFSVRNAYKMFLKAKEAGFMNDDLLNKLKVCEKMANE